VFERLGLALAIGLLVGGERGWEARGEPEGRRVAGIRTFALVGLSGGIWGVVGSHTGNGVLAAAFVAMAALVIAAHVSRLKIDPDVGITTEVAQLLTFALGALAAMGEMAGAAAGGVVTMALLSAKQSLHSWLEKFDRLEMRATIRLLLISVVVLPVLPNQGFGPEGVLNPFLLWLLVVMVATISFLGYFAIKLAGPRIGSLLTGFFGGLASSTALTVSFARMGRESPGLQPQLAAGIVVANSTMYARLWLVVLVLNHKMAWSLAPPLAAMLVAGLIATAVLWRARGAEAKPGETSLSNPFELATAVKFALLLTLVVLASKLMQTYVGAVGLYGLAAVAGLADVDAIALSMAQMSADGISVAIAATAVTIAAFINTAVKAALVGSLCGGTMARQITVVVAAVIAAGGVGLAVQWGW
jgi:uncharacterized membrane protein (DUF4010 family)